MTNAPAASPTTSRLKKLAPVVLIVIVVVIIGIVPSARVTMTRGLALLATGQFAQFREYLTGLGAWAPVVSVLLMIAGSVAVPIPGTLLMVANGLVFGVWRGALISLIGGVAGSLTAYTLGRVVGRSIIERLLPAASLRAADRLMSKYGGWAVAIERVIPGLPGDPVSYVAGLTRMPVAFFALLTIVGLAPADLVTAYFGADVAGDVPLRYWLTGVAVVAIIVIWRYVRRRRANAIT